MPAIFGVLMGIALLICSIKFRKVTPGFNEGFCGILLVAAALTTIPLDKQWVILIDSRAVLVQCFLAAEFCVAGGFLFVCGFWVWTIGNKLQAHGANEPLTVHEQNIGKVANFIGPMLDRK